MTMRPANATFNALCQALDTLRRDDPTLALKTNPDLSEVTLFGMGELHLEVVRDRLLREHGIDIAAGPLQVICVETIRKVAEAEGKFIRQTGPRGQYGHVVLRLEPNPAGGNEFINGASAEVVPARYIPAIEEGVAVSLQGGVIAGYELIDVKTTLLGGSYHEQDSSEMAHKIAASMAVRDAARKASPVLLEPVMSVEVVVPEEFMGTVVNDLNARRGRIEGMEYRDGSQRIHASVPLSGLFGYASELRSSTQGRGTFSWQFSRYEEAPRPFPLDDSGGVAVRRPSGPSPRSGAARARPEDC